jgi:DNA-binding IclR family transcriptional regulator
MFLGGNEVTAGDVMADIAVLPMSIPSSGVAGQKADVPAVRKTVAIIRYLNGRAPRGATLRETASDLRITNSHCHNILRTLIGHDWVGYDPESRCYRLRPGLYADAWSAFSQFEPIAELRLIVAQLASTIGLTCILSRVEPDGTFVVVDKADGTNGFAVTAAIGHRFSADAPVQRKAILAWQPEAAVNAWLDGWVPVAHTSASITDRGDMLEDLRVTRARGYALSGEEYIPGIMSVGLPIFDRAANPVMVLQCPALTESLAPRERQVARSLQQAVTRAHALLGSRVPRSFRFPEDPA